MFGNPGSTELPMLADFPERLQLCARPAGGGRGRDGRRLRPGLGKTTVVNLHTAPGVGNAMGAIFNAQANHSPLLITAGQQARAQITLQANLTNRDATRMPHPLVKWSFEPPRAEDVPLALGHGAHLAGLAAARPGLRLAADGRLVRRGRRGRRQSRDRAQGRRPRHGQPRGGPRPRRAPRRGRPTRSSSPAPTSTPPAPGTPPSPSPSASASRSGPRRRPAASASASPRTTPTSAASCRRRSARSGRRSRATT